jgi:hypothetical protein
MRRVNNRIQSCQIRRVEYLASLGKCLSPKNILQKSEHMEENIAVKNWETSDNIHVIIYLKILCWNLKKLRSETQQDELPNTVNDVNEFSSTLVTVLVTSSCAANV